MTTTVALRSQMENRIRLLQWATLGWMFVECSVALTAAWRAKGVSLLAFGSDSFVEPISAVVVLLQFTSTSRVSQTGTAKLCGLLLYGLAAVVFAIAFIGLHLHTEAETSHLGMGITIGALLLMPVFASLSKTQPTQAVTRHSVRTLCSPLRVPTWRRSR